MRQGLLCFIQTDGVAGTLWPLQPTPHLSAPSPCHTKIILNSGILGLRHLKVSSFNKLVTNKLSVTVNQGDRTISHHMWLSQSLLPQALWLADHKTVCFWQCAQRCITVFTITSLSSLVQMICWARWLIGIREERLSLTKLFQSSQWTCTACFLPGTCVFLGKEIINMKEDLASSENHLSLILYARKNRQVGECSAAPMRWSVVLGELEDKGGHILCRAGPRVKEADHLYESLSECEEGGAINLESSNRWLPPIYSQPVQHGEIYC